MGAEGMSRMLANAGVGQVKKGKRPKNTAKTNSTGDEPKQAIPHVLFVFELLGSTPLFFGRSFLSLFRCSLRRPWTRPKSW